MSWFAGLAALLFVLCVPVTLIANNVRWVTLDSTTYRTGFEKYRATERTGLSADQLKGVADAFISYFQAPPGSLNPNVTIGGTQRLLFNEREVTHMEDVQHLMRLVFRAAWVAGLYILAFAALTIVQQRGAGWPFLGRLLLWGSGTSIGLLLLVAALSFVDFGELFVRFHRLAFRNDLWMLDPSADYLLMLFPEGFWFDVTLRIAALTAGEAVGLAALGFWLSRH